MLSPLPLASCTSEIESWSSEGGSAERGGAGPSAKGLQRLLTHLSRRTYWLRGQHVGQALELDVGARAGGTERRVSGGSNRDRGGGSPVAAQAVSLLMAHVHAHGQPVAFEQSPRRRRRGPHNLAKSQRFRSGLGDAEKMARAHAGPPSVHSRKMAAARRRTGADARRAGLPRSCGQCRAGTSLTQGRAVMVASER